MKVVVCNGGYRTGSTLSFHICLKIAEKNNVPNLNSVGTSDEVIREILGQDHGNSWWIIKSHTFKKIDKIYPNLKLIHSYRNPLSVAASHQTRHGMPEDDADYMNYVFSYLKEQRETTLSLKDKKSCLLVSYDKLVDDTVNSVKSIAKHIGLPLTDEQANEIKEDVSVEKTKEMCNQIDVGGINAYTQMRYGQIGKYDGRTDYWKEILSDSLINKIKNEIGIDYINF